MIPNEYLINDKRDITVFKKNTFSGYNTKDVLTILNKSLLDCKIEESCNWGIELLISGDLESFFEKIVTISIKNININNPKLPFFLYSRYSTYIKLLNNNSNLVLLLRNNQQIRNLIGECCFVICNSLKTKNIGLTKIKQNDFEMIHIESKLIASSNTLIDDKTKYGDPEEATLVMNEFNYNLINKNYELCVYWLSWIIEWEKKNTKKNKIYMCGYREIQNIDKKNYNDIIWFIWEIILKESNKLDNEIIIQIHSLYKLFKFNYKLSKKSKRLPYLLYAIKYFNNSYYLKYFYNNYYLMVQVCSNINKIIFEKNKYATNNITKLEKEKYNTNLKHVNCDIKNKENKLENRKKQNKIKKLQKIAEQKMRFKISKVEEIDSLILKNK